jgi:hypothetical protein
MSVLVTGGAGFLRSHLVERLRAAGMDPIVPRRQEFDLTRAPDVERLFEESRPRLVFHLAAEVGGIGANQANPGRYWYANLIMGAHTSSGRAAPGSTSSSCSERFAPIRSSRRRRFAKKTSGTGTPRRRTRRTESPRRHCAREPSRIASSTA